VSASEKEGQPSKAVDREARRLGAARLAAILRSPTARDLVKQLEKDSIAFLEKLEAEYAPRFKALLEGKSKRSDQGDKSQSPNESSVKAKGDSDSEA
jgi:hypothetical protein